MTYWIVLAILIVLIIGIILAYVIYTNYKINNQNVANSLASEIKFISAINQMISHNNIDIPIYYINLKRSPERHEYMQKQIEQHNVKFWTRIEGVNGKTDPTVKYINNFNKFRTLTNGEVGCCLSHLRAIKQAYDDGVEYALILEDDASFDLAAHWDKPLSEIIARAPENWTILQLYSDSDYTVISEDYCCPAKRGLRAILALAYVINRSAMGRLLDRVLKDETYILCPSIHYRGEADYYIYNILDGCNRYLSNPPLFMANNLDLLSTIHIHHQNLHLNMALNTVDLYFNKIIKSPKYHTLELFNYLAQSKIIYEKPKVSIKIDIVLAYYKHDFSWLFSALSFLKRTDFRLFVYSKGGQIIPEAYKPYIHQLVELNNIGRCDHTYIYHLLNVTSRSSKTFLVKDSGLNFMDLNWLKYNIRQSSVIGPNMNFRLYFLADFSLNNYNKSHDQNKGDPFIKAPTQLLTFKNWSRFVFGADFDCKIIDKIIYSGLILWPNKKLDKMALIRAGFTLSYGSNMETGHYMERAWAYILS